MCVCVFVCLCVCVSVSVCLCLSLTMSVCVCYVILYQVECDDGYNVACQISGKAMSLSQIL